MDDKTFFAGKRITVMGLGLLGRNVGDAEFLAKQGAEVRVTDLKTERELEESVARLKKYPNISFTLGGHRQEDFEQCDMVLKGASVPLDSPFIAAAHKRDIPVFMSAALFHTLSGIPMIGITGTRGKSTVTHMIAAILTRAGKKIILGGNIRGVSNLALLEEVEPEHFAVFELDSWQLQGFAEKSPDIAVFTTFYDDHLNYYNNDRAQYLADKANIFLHQDEGDVLVIGAQAQDALARYKRDIRARVTVADEHTVPKGWMLKIPGAHNRYNAGLALTAARALAIDDEVSQVALASFIGLPGRLEFLRELDGVKIFNDNNATTPDATIAALRAFPEANGRIVLIMGGSDKGLETGALLEEIGKTCKAMVLLKGTGTGKLQTGHLGVRSTTVDTLAEALEKALAFAEPGDLILFSPAFASFGMFKNEYDRGEQFNVLVSRL